MSRSTRLKLLQYLREQVQKNKKDFDRYKSPQERDSYNWGYSTFGDITMEKQ